MNLLHANDRAGEYPASYYSATAQPFARAPALKGAQRASIAIIGGGYTGLSAALHLAEAGHDVAVLEAHRMGFGASGRNGGQLGSGQRQEQNWLEARLGRGDAHLLWELGEEAKALVRSLIDQHNMPVDYRPGIAHACRSAREVRAAHEYAETLSRDYGYDACRPLGSDEMRACIGSKRYLGGSIDHGAGHLHPLNFALGLAAAARAAGARLFEGSEVERIDKSTAAQPIVHTAHGTLRCDHLILACNGYLGALAPQVSAKVMPINNFIVATEPLGEREILSSPIAVADSNFVVNYWRLSPDNRLLFGGGESYGHRFPADLRRTVSKPMLKIYPQLAGVKLDYAWGGTLAITMNRMPAFLRLAPNILSASGYSGHGLGMATLAGKVLAEAVGGQAARFDVLARVPHRTFPGGDISRAPLLALAMTWYALRDRLGV